MSFEQISWVFVVIALAGNIFVIQKNVFGQWLWTVSNIGLTCFNLYLGAWSQAFLFGVYLGLSIWGIISWTKENKQVSQV